MAKAFTVWSTKMNFLVLNKLKKWWNNFDQSHYIEKVLRNFNYFNGESSKTPIDSHCKLIPNNDALLNQEEYAKWLVA